jgi:hypothetical protein
MLLWQQRQQVLVVLVVLSSHSFLRDKVANESLTPAVCLWVKDVRAVDSNKVSGVVSVTIERAVSMACSSSKDDELLLGCTIVLPPCEDVIPSPPQPPLLIISCMLPVKLGLFLNYVRLPGFVTSVKGLTFRGNDIHAFFEGVPFNK